MVSDPTITYLEEVVRKTTGYPTVCEKERKAMAQALIALLEEHQPKVFSDTSMGRGGIGGQMMVTGCKTCRMHWPCPTRRTITSALGITEEQ